MKELIGICALVWFGIAVDKTFPTTVPAVGLWVMSGLAAVIWVIL